MELPILWFILIGVLFTGFFILEGFDFGVGILMPLLGRTDAERRTILRSIGPVWDGNEVWLLTAGGGIFATFPRWYATMFSSLYLPLVLVLVGLILRGLALEYRNKLESPHWRAHWDKAVFLGSLLPALLFGVAMTDLLYGLPIDAQGNFQGNFLDLIRPFPLLGGLASLTMFLWIGSLFLRLKLQDDLCVRAESACAKLGWLALACLVLLGLVGFGSVSLLVTSPWAVKGIAVFAALDLFLSILFRRRPGIAFLFTGLSIGMTSAAFFAALFPHTVVSSLQADWSLTIWNASSSPYTLKVMTGVAAIFVPVVLIYQAWSYWVFRKRIRVEGKSDY
ncbi:MAG TPA: cytochrome d ubiquinol oxidase subunit II [Fibrobacteraceae bacterium]|nr:cytochrome d ubiquinol oxidase subunit II [Fibrobacteraceae bacterium]